MSGFWLTESPSYDLKIEENEDKNGLTLVDTIIYNELLKSEPNMTKEDFINYCKELRQDKKCNKEE